MKQETIDLLNKLTDLELAKVSYTLNCWQFPEELKSLNPEMFEKYDWEKVYEDLVILFYAEKPFENKEMSDFFELELRPVMSIISIRIGERAISKYSNTFNGKMTDEQFNVWWERRYDGL